MTTRFEDSAEPALNALADDNGRRYLQYSRMLSFAGTGLAAGSVLAAVAGASIVALVFASLLGGAAALLAAKVTGDIPRHGGEKLR